MQTIGNELLRVGRVWVRTLAPTVDDDETVGYVVGDTWFRVFGEIVREYRLSDASEGAANWRIVGLPVASDLYDVILGRQSLWWDDDDTEWKLFRPMRAPGGTSTLGAIPVFAGTDGQLMNDSGVTISDITDAIADKADADHTHGGGGGEAFPVGSVFISVVDTDPSTLLGYGTWSAFGAGRVLVGVDSDDEDFDDSEVTGGEKGHTLTSDEMPSHTHVQNAHTHTQNAHTHIQNAHNHLTWNGNNYVTGLSPSGGGSGSAMSSSGTFAGLVTGNTTPTNQNATAVNQNATATNQNTGGDDPHNNLQPYITVYMWKRTA